MSNPRIIAGKARGCRLQAVPGDTTRPITDRVKEAVFNIIGQDIYDAAFLDLFGGTGSVSLEALSRGASFARLIDKNHLAVKTIQANLEHTGLKEGAEVLCMDAFQYLRRQPDRRFDYVYVAPPQYKEMWKQALRELDQQPGWLTPDCWVIVQIHPMEFEELQWKNFVEIDRRQYGSTLVVVYQPPLEAAGD